jgi:UDP-N-acetylmuramyl pentapeptide phosphotransferase/UDP-N-acetylglucosamine-1-phosphate transferase
MLDGLAGSSLLGFVLAELSLALVQPGSVALDPIVVLWMMPIPIFEPFTSTTRRIVRGMLPTEADTGHFHHVLVRLVGRFLEAGLQGISRTCPEGHGCCVVRGSVGHNT